MRDTRPNRWGGNFGIDEIPDEVLEGVRLTKWGYPDKRNVLAYQRFMKWVQEQEDKAQEEI